MGSTRLRSPGVAPRVGRDQALFNALDVAAAAADQIAEALHDDAAAQHVGKTGDGLAVAVGILEGLGEMLGNQQGEVGVLGLHRRVLVAVAVDGDDAVGIFVDHDAVGVHAEGADVVLEFFGAVDDLAFVQFVGQVGEYHRGQLHPHADVHPVGAGFDAHIPADRSPSTCCRCGPRRRRSLSQVHARRIRSDDHDSRRPAMLQMFRTGVSKKKSTFCFSSVIEVFQHHIS